MIVFKLLNGHVHFRELMSDKDRAVYTNYFFFFFFFLRYTNTHGIKESLKRGDQSRDIIITVERIIPEYSIFLVQ